MNGRGDTVGVTFLAGVLDRATGRDTLARGDTVRILPRDHHPDDPDAIRLYLTGAAIDRDDTWRTIERDGYRRSVTYMNGRQSTLGVSLPAPEVADISSDVDATMAAVAPGTVDVFLPR